MNRTAKLLCLILCSHCFCLDGSIFIYQLSTFHCHLGLEANWLVYQYLEYCFVMCFPSLALVSHLLSSYRMAVWLRAMWTVAAGHVSLQSYLMLLVMLWAVKVVSALLPGSGWAYWLSGWGWPGVEGGDKAMCWSLTTFPTIPRFPNVSPNLLLTFSRASTA